MKPWKNIEVYACEIPNFDQNKVTAKEAIADFLSEMMTFRFRDDLITHVLFHGLVTNGVRHLSTGYY